MRQWLAERISYFFRPESVSSDAPNRVLIIAPGSFRTAFRALSPLTYLVERFPSSEFAMVVSPEAIPLLQTNTALSVLFPWSVEHSGTHWNPSIRELQAWESFAPDWVVVLDPHCSRIADRLSAPVKIGFCDGPIDKFGRSGYLTHSAKKSDRWRMWFDRLGGAPDTELPPTLAIPPEKIQHAEERWGERAGRAVLLLPGSSKKWAKFWATLESSLQFHDYYPERISGTLFAKMNDEAASQNVVSPEDLVALCATAQVCVVGDEEYAAIATISRTPTGRFDALGGLWEGDRSRHLVYRHELDADIATAMSFIREVLPLEPELVTSVVEEDNEIHFEREFE